MTSQQFTITEMHLSDERGSSAFSTCFISFHNCLCTYFTF